MSVEVCFVLMGEVKEKNHTLIEPGEGMYFDDYSNGSKEVITVECQPDGFPKVTVFPDKGPLADGHEGVIDGQELPEPISTISVDKRRPHDHQIVTRDEVAGTLRVRYADNSRITAALAIPYLLRHSN